MKTKYILSIIILLLGIKNSLATSYTWVGNTSTSWNVNSNWNPSTGVPDSSDNVTISTGTYNLALDQNRKVTNLTLTSKTINLSTYTLTVYGTATMNSGTVTNGTFKCRGTLASFKGTLMDCTVDAVCGYIQLSGSTFNDVADFTDQGTATGTGTGGCTFNGNVTITHNGTLTYFTLANTTGDTFNANVTFTNNSNREINVATSGSTSFNGNIIVNSTSTGGILFANSGGTSTLASGKTISVGGSGFTADYLTLKNFTQTGSTAQTLTLTSTAIVNMISSTFNGNLTITAPGFLLKNNTFNGTVTLTRNASSGNHQSDGGNTFNSTVTVDNAGSSGRIRFATTTADTFNGNATFSSTGGQDVQIAYSGNTIFEGNLTINSNKVVFNTASGKVTFSGGNAQTLNGSYNFPFKKLAINKSANNVTANTTLGVDDTLFFINGKLITTSTNLLTMKAGSVSSGASNSSFVSGPVKKIGNTAFQFPVGKNSVFRKVEITAPTNSTDAFTAEYFDSTQVLGGTMDTTITFISDCGYWNLSRTTGTSNITPKFAFDSTHCDYLSIKPVHIAFWNGTKWIDKGEGVTDSNNKKTSAAVSSYGNFALSYKLIPGEAPQFPYMVTMATNCSSTDLLFENTDMWLSLTPDSAVVKVGLFTPDSLKLYASIKQVAIYEQYRPQIALSFLKDWQWQCDSSLNNSLSFATELTPATNYLMKISKYETGECEGIYDTTNYFLNACLINLRTNPNTTVHTYTDAEDLLTHLGNGTLDYAGDAINGDIVAPASAGLIINLDQINTGGQVLTPLFVREGVRFIGDYDLLSEPCTLSTTPPFSGNYTLNTSPTGTIITFSGRGYDYQNSLNQSGYMFVMLSGATISNLRIQGAMSGFQDFNHDDYLCAGIRMLPPATVDPYLITHCELFNFSYTSVYARAGTDEVKIDHCYIHNVKGMGGNTTAKGYGTWLQGALPGTTTGNDFTIKNCIFDECKSAVDMQPNATNVIVDSCTFGEFFLEETINRHSFDCSTCEYTHPHNPILPICTYYQGTTPYLTSSNFVIHGPAAGDFNINQSIFYQTANTISIPYPANTPVSQTSPPKYNIVVTNNTFSINHAAPSSYDYNYGGYLRLNDNFADECVWDWERLTDIHGDLTSTSGLPAILVNTPNSFSYQPQISTTNNCPQPPEVDFDYFSVNGYVNGLNSTSPKIPFINENGDVNINLRHGNLGSDNVAYIVRPHPNNGDPIDLNSSGENSYNSFQFITDVESSDISLLLNSGSTPSFNTALPGLYGIDVIAVDGNSNSRYYASKSVHKPLIIAPADNHLLIFNIKDSYFSKLYGKPNDLMGVYKQVELNGNIIWREDIASGGDDWERVQIDLFGTYVDESSVSHDIASYFDTDKINQTITFSIAMPDPANVITGGGIPLVGDILRGLRVFVDDVYLKSFDSPENLIRDGDIENNLASGIDDEPSTDNAWYYQNLTSFTPCTSLTDASDTPTVIAETEVRFTAIERKSGKRAIVLTLPGINYSTPCSTYDNMTPTPSAVSNAVVSAAVDFDYRDFFGCADYTNTSLVNEYEPFPATAYACTTNTTHTLKKYVVDDDIVVSNNSILEIKGCKLLFTAPHKIIIESGSTLHVIPDLTGTTYTKTYLFGCEEMWGGIENNGGTIDMFNFLSGATPAGYKTEINDAQIAIDNDGGKIEARFVIFDHNETSLFIHSTDFPFSGTSSFIKGSEFRCSNGSFINGANANFTPFYHVRFENVDFPFVFGDANGLKNSFSDALGGIDIFNSSISMENNEFINITSQNYWPGYGKAINIFTSSNSANLNINIGSMTSGLGNSFTNVVKGVNAYSICPTCTLAIKGNTFNNSGNIGVVSYNNYFNTAINIVNPISSSGLVAVYGNIITDNRIGIHAMNVPGIHIGSDEDDIIQANSIHYNMGATPTSTDYFTGIWCQSCNGAIIKSNTIQNDEEVTTTGLANFRGIDIENSNDCRINCNSISNLPRSMYFTGDCNFTKLRKNQFANYENAVELFDNQTILSDQGEDPGTGYIPYDNEWTDGTSVVFRTYRNSPNPNPLEWYYDISNNNGPLHDPEPSNIVTHQPRNVGCGCDCNTNTRIMDRDRSIGRILNDSISFSVHPNEFSYQAKMNVFLAMKVDSTLIYQGSPNDSVYLNFFNAIKNTNINRLDSVSILTDQLLTLDAITLNDAISDTNYVEYYLKVVKGIYLNGPASGNELSSSDSTTLENIAYLPVSQAGRAVYIAAAILGLEVHQNTEEETRLSNSQVQIPEKFKSDALKVYPNPSNNKIFFNFEGVDWSLQNSLRVYDSKGKLIVQQNISVNLFELNVTNLKPGIYRFMFNSSNEILFKGNFAVTH